MKKVRIRLLKITLFCIVISAIFVAGFTWLFNLNLLLAFGYMILIYIAYGFYKSFYKEFRYARRMDKKKEYEEAIEAYLEFITKVQERKNRKLKWLYVGLYTADIEAMALNNIGISNYHLEQFDEAIRYYEAAIKMDPDYAVPYFNLAVLTNVRGDIRKAETFLKQAQELGYRGSLYGFMVVQGRKMHPLIVETNHQEEGTSMKAVVYESNSGFTKEYADLLAGRLNVPTYDRKSAEKKLTAGDEIVYMGWIMAGSIKGYDKAVVRYKIKAVCAVGMGSPEEKQTEDLRKKNHFGEEFFYLRGGYDINKLHGLNKIMMTVMSKSIIKSTLAKQDKTEEDFATLEMFQKGKNFVDMKNLEPLISWLDANVGTV